MPQKRKQLFPVGQEPDFWRPDPEIDHHRFALGRLQSPTRAVNPMVVLAMNPSHADRTESDMTINRIIQAATHHGHDGWIMLNLYPERATSHTELSSFDPALWAMNWTEIEQVLDSHGIAEVFGAWGNPPNKTIATALDLTLSALRSRNTRIYYFGTLTKKQAPRHPRPRSTPWEYSGSKSYLF